MEQNISRVCRKKSGVPPPPSSIYANNVARHLNKQQGSLAITLVKRYEPDVAGNRMQAFAESTITGSVTAQAEAMCYYTVRRDGYHHLRYDWKAN